MTAIGRGNVLRFCCSALVVLSVMLTCTFAKADTLIRVFAIRGFMGVAFSRGMNQLCDALETLHGVTCTVEDWYDESDIMEKAAAAMAAGERVVLVGHSLGAHRALYIAGQLNGIVPLVVSIDPNWFAPPPVPENAEVVLNFYQDFDVLGRAVLKAPPNYHGDLEQFQLQKAHIMIDQAPEIRDQVMSRVTALLSDSITQLNTQGRAH